MRKPWVRSVTLAGMLCLLGWTGVPKFAGAQVLQDSVATPTHQPKGALWRAAVLPGWGQVYNRQYLKVPVVYLGLGGLTASAFYVNSRYLRYRHAYLYTARTHEDGTPVFPEYAKDYARLLDELGYPPESELSPEEVASRRKRLESAFRSQRTALRRNRDLLYIGTFAWYGLTILDAYVSAHLLDFDVGEDLTLRLHPNPAAPGLTAIVRLDGE